MNQNKKIQEHLSKLGYKAKDKITGMEGILTSICFDLYGCCQYLINGGLDKDGKLKENYWFDENRIVLTSSTPVMDQPLYVENRYTEAGFFTVDSESELKFGTETENEPKGPESKPSFF